MKLISWNVNGYRACLNHGLMDFMKAEDPDILCIQETKLQPGQADIERDGYYHYISSAVKKGYSGTLIYTKKEPISVNYGLGIEAFDQEGRVITCEFEQFYLVNVYVPNSQHELARLDFRRKFNEAFRTYTHKLDSLKPVIMCGDFNVAHQDIDLKNPDQNRKNAGFTWEERTDFTDLLGNKLIDSYRFLYPNEVAYSWWSYRFNARSRNIGWRIDYFLVSNSLTNELINAGIYENQLGSDHAPVFLKINL